jgi:DNA-binding response OmpR family regulator
MKPRLLVVEDDETTSKQLFWTLSGPYQVLIASDMRTAVRRAMLYRPGISIVDLQQTVRTSLETGLRVIEYLKSHLPGSKVLAIGPGRSDEMLAACAAVGADEFLARPFETEQLLGALRRIAPAPEV